MSCNDLPSKAKQRFKGVESFLRRIAFNLGNTPSQTEVKIISCIPIDVTDLQQKILTLEKQLEAVKTHDYCPENQDPKTSSVVQTALCKAYSRHSSVCKPIDTSPAGAAGCCEGYTVTSCMSASGPPRSSKPANCMCWSSEASSPEDPLLCSNDCRKSIFKKQKKKKEKPKKKDKNKTQFVYYAQTTNSPFSNILGDQMVNEKRPQVEESVSRAYISHMIRKQYMPVPIIQNNGAGSEFSSPVCRDTEQGCSEPLPYDSDVCSCCYGPFHNIDGHLPRRARAEPRSALPTCSVNEQMINGGFYDTSLYDMVPVKEKSAPISKSYYESSRRRSPNNNMKIQSYPERRRSRTRVHPYVNLVRAPVVPNLSKRTTTRATNRKEPKSQRISPRIDNVQKCKVMETSDSCCVDCSHVYTKRVFANNKTQELPKPPVPVLHKNAECLTQIFNDTECQTTTTQSVQIDQGLLEEKKTEETLNQIKTILQTVLTEVKTNTHVKKVPEDKPTKDAVVQKGPSQGNMPGCSTLLHSYTYSPYNMNPYLASCSRQIPSGGCCFPTMPYTSGKCMHNYPVFIQTPPRHMCAGCFRNSSHIPKMGQVKQATTAATNTDSKEPSKETEKLIKEIYKSMTVNMEFPTKETSASDYNEVKSTTRSNNKSLYRASVLDDGMRKFVKANATKKDQKMATPLDSSEGKILSNTISTRSQLVSTTDTERRLRNRRLESYLETVEAQKRRNKIMEEQTRHNKIVEEREYEEATVDTTASDEEESSSETEQRVSYKATGPSKKSASIQKTEPPKKGLFSKMFKSVKFFGNKSKRKEEQIQVEVEDGSENSDDYQTVYSQRVEWNPRHIPYPVRAVRSPHRIKAHSKISYSRHMRDRNQERSRRSPYMEQEYRRHWNERFHENQLRYSSETPFSRGTPRKPVYWQNYEARTAMIGRNCGNQNSVSPEVNGQKIIRSQLPSAELNLPRGGNTASKGLAWLKKHKLGINCGPQWKKFILEG